jgi:hypothetical protein
LKAACCSCIFERDAAACRLVTARSKPVVAAGPLGAAAATLPAPGFAKPPLAAGAEAGTPCDDGFAKPPLACGDAAVGGEAEPGFEKPPLDGEPAAEANGTRPHSAPLLWLDKNRACELGANPAPTSRRAAAAMRQKSPNLTMIPFELDDRSAAPTAYGYRVIA